MKPGNLESASLDASCNTLTRACVYMYVRAKFLLECLIMAQQWQELFGSLGSLVYAKCISNQIITILNYRYFGRTDWKTLSMVQFARGLNLLNSRHNKGIAGGVASETAKTIPAINMYNPDNVFMLSFDFDYFKWNIRQFSSSTSKLLSKIKLHKYRVIRKNWFYFVIE